MIGRTFKEPVGVGRRVAEAREAAAMTQEQVARAIGVDRTAISKIESGKRGLSSLELVKIARFLGLPIEWFISARSQPSGNYLLRRARSKREEIIRIANKFGARQLRIFGSAARGEATSESDLDFLVEMPGRTLLDRVGLILELQDLLGCKVHVLTVPSLRDGTRERVLAEARPL